MNNKYGYIWTIYVVNSPGNTAQVAKRSYQFGSDPDRSSNCTHVECEMRMRNTNTNFPSPGDRKRHGCKIATLPTMWISMSVCVIVPEWCLMHLHLHLRIAFWFGSVLRVRKCAKTICRKWFLAARDFPIPCLRSFPFFDFVCGFLPAGAVSQKYADEMRKK